MFHSVIRQSQHTKILFLIRTPCGNLELRFHSFIQFFRFHLPYFLSVNKRFLRHLPGINAKHQVAFSRKGILLSRPFPDFEHISLFRCPARYRSTHKFSTLIPQISSCIFIQGERRFIALLGELLLDPVTRNGRYLAEYVDSERANLLDSIRSIRNDKRDWADLRLLQEMCAGEPYGISRFGDEAGLAKINNQKLYAHSQRMMSSSRLELFYCGSAECHRVEEALLTAFSSLTRGPQTEPEPPRRFAAPSQPRLVTEEMDVTQGKLSMGFRCDTDDEPAMILANLMFGGSSNSKLFLNVREKLSLCYYASSTYVRSKGILTVSSGIETADYDRAEAEILRQLDEIRQGLWEDWELTAARESLLSALQALGDSQGALENYYLGLAATGRRETPEEMAALLRQVTPERIRAAAQSVQLDTIYFLKGKEA